MYSRRVVVLISSTVMLITLAVLVFGLCAGAVAAQGLTPESTDRPGIITVLTVTPPPVTATAMMEPTTAVTPAATQAAVATRPAPVEATPTAVATATAPVAPAAAPTLAPSVPPTGTASSSANAAVTAAGSMQAPAGTIVVVGEGQLSVKPDIARVNVGVETVKPTVKEASDQTKAAMDAVLKAIKAQGVADKDIQTSGFSIFMERNSSQPGQAGSEQVLYHVSNSVNITIRDLNQVSGLLDATIEAGANNIYGVTFAVEDPKKVEAQARQLAVADALRRAQDLARLNGVQVGNVLSISEVVANQGGFVANSFRDVAVGKGGGGGTISPGELEMTMQLQITYAMQ